MIALTRRNTFLLGAALVVVVNALALAGVAWNREGEPESVLVLSGRELAPDVGRLVSNENSNRVLGLQVQTLTRFGASRGYYPGYFPGGEAGPAWLDEEKLNALGFDVRPPQGSAEDVRHRSAQVRDVYLALELAGQSWRDAVAFAHANVARVEQQAPRDAARDAVERDEARKALRAQEAEESRLFVIDADRDAVALRARHPDRRAVAILRGQVEAAPRYVDEQWKILGYVGRIDTRALNVPRPVQPALDAWWGLDMKRDPSRLAVEVAIGRRFEPWIRSVSLLPAAPVTPVTVPAQTRE